MIPKNLHTIWISNDTPNMDLRHTWTVFDTWNINHWNDNKILQEFGDDILLRKLYENEGPTKVSDYVRLLILKRYGGVYCDIDTHWLKPIDSFLDRQAFTTYQFSKIKNPKKYLDKGLRLKDQFDGTATVSLFEYYNTDIYLNNSIIGSIPNGKFINKFIEVYKNDYAKPIQERFSFVDYGCGPAMTTHVASLFTDLDGETTHTTDLSVFDSVYFHPYNYIKNANALKTRNFKNNLINQIQEAERLDSFCVHIQSSSECDNYRKIK